MAVRIAVGLSQSFDTVEAFGEAAEEARQGLGAPCDVAIVFAGGPHLSLSKWILSTVHERLEPRTLIGCGAGGVLGAGAEVEDGAGAAVWALSAPGAEIESHHLSAAQTDDGAVIDGIPDDPGDALILLADPYTFATDALLAHLNERHPGLPVLGGLASAALGGSALLLRDGDVHTEGAVACALRGLPVLAAVSQGARPLGPEMRVTECEGNLIRGLAGKPALDRLGEVIGSLPESERALATDGVLLGIVIDENRAEYERGDFLVRPLIGVVRSSGAIAVGERVKVGQTVRLHARDAASADEDLREALRRQSEALGPSGAAGALLFTCNGRGSHMFSMPDHDAGALQEVLGVPAAGFFCAGEIGPVGGQNFLHGFTATMAVFPA